MTASSHATPESTGAPIGLPAPPTRGRWQWQLLGLALGAFAALLVAPQTGPIAREFTGSVLPAMTPARVVEMVTDPSRRLSPVVMAHYRNDVEISVANALGQHDITERVDRYGNTAPIELAEPHRFDGELMAMREVMQRFPDSAVPRVAFLRLALCGPVTLKGLTSGVPRNGDPPHPLPSTAAINSATILADYLQAAQEGVRIEPQNAYFPTMEAIAHLLENDGPRGRRAACAALDRAAHLPDWNDHSAEVVRGFWRLDAELYGLHDSWTRSTAAANFICANSALQDLGACIDFEANAQESRHPEIAVALRARLARIAALIRAHCPAALDMGQSDMLFQAARSGKLEEGKGSRPVSQEAYLHSLRAHHFDAEADWLKRVDVPQNRDLILVLENDQARWLWMKSWFLFLQLTPFAVIGGHLAVRRYQRRFDRSLPRPLSSDAVWGSLLGFITVFSTCAILLEGQPDTATALFSSGGTLLLLSSVVGVLTMLRRTWLLAQSYGLTLLCLLTLMGVTSWSMTGVFRFLQVQMDLSGSKGGAIALDQMLRGAIGFSALFLILPALLALGLMGFSRMRRTPVAAGVARGFGSLTLPILSLLIFGCVGQMFQLANFETRLKHQTDRALMRPASPPLRPAH